MLSPEVPAAARIRATVFVVDLARKGYEMDNLDLRISQLEITK